MDSRTATSAGRTTLRRCCGIGHENLDAIERAVGRPGHRLRLRAHGRDGRGRRAAPADRARGARRTGASRSARTWSCSMRSRLGARRLADATSVPRTTHAAWLWSTRRGSRGACDRRASTPASGSSSAPRSGDHGSRRPGDGGVAPWRGAWPIGVALATNAYPPLLRRLAHYVVPVYDYVLMTEPLTRAAVVGHRLERAGGRQRHGQPVPLLPDDRGRAHPVGRLRRHLPPRQRLRAAVRAQPGVVRAPRRALPPDVPATGRHPVLARLGRRDRHVLAVQRLLGDRPWGPHGLRRRLHGPGRRRIALRRTDDARPARRSDDGAHRTRDGAHQADPLPARADPLVGHQPDHRGPAACR